MTSSSTVLGRSDYEYRPLDRDKKSIRLMSLHPAEDVEAELCCDILEARCDSDDSPDYEAISYVWEGQVPNEDQYIICKDDKTNPKKLLITRNSATVLRHLRKNDDLRVLWMDSICIDQSSTQDRNHQVLLMGDIYTHALRVLIWLGEDKSLKAGPTFRLLERIAQVYVDSEADNKSTADKDNLMEEDEDSDMEESEDDDLGDGGDNGEDRDEWDDDHLNSNMDETGADKITADKHERREVESTMQSIWNSKNTWPLSVVGC